MTPRFLPISSIRNTPPPCVAGWLGGLGWVAGLGWLAGWLVGKSVSIKQLVDVWSMYGRSLVDFGGGFVVGLGTLLNHLLLHRMSF